VEAGIDLDLDAALEAAGADVAEVREFILDRLRHYYAEQGVPPQQFEAVGAALAPRPDGGGSRHGGEPVPGRGASAAPTGLSLADFDRRLKAIAEFALLPEAEALAAANKRIRNILRKAEGAIPQRVDAALFAEDAERELAEAVDAAIADTDTALEQRDYVAVLGRLARLRPQVDAFFDQVMVNADDPAIR